MTPTDKKLYELFSNKTLSEGCLVRQEEFDYEFKMPKEIECDVMVAIKNGWGFRQLHEIKESEQFHILGHEPQLHDVFRVAEIKKIPIRQYSPGGYLHIQIDQGFMAMPDEVSYNPTFSLLSQSDETKLAIINLFTND